MRTFVVIILAPALASMLGCVDATPSDFTVPDAGAGGSGGGGASDADNGDMGGGLVEQCMACLAAPEDPGPGCATAYNACAAFEQCVKIVTCGIEIGCPAKPTMGENQLCAVPCFVMNGVSGLGDPIIPIVSPVGDCAYTVCRTACGGM